MNNNELIQENCNESVEVNNPYIPGLNSLESDEIAKHSGSYSVPPLRDFNESTTLSNDSSLIEIENQITDGNTISSNNYDFLTGTTGSSPLLNVAKDFDLNPDLSTVDINLNRLDTSTSALSSPDSLGERFDRSSNTILTIPQPTDLTQSSNADANDSDAVVSSPISDQDSSFDGENSGQVTIEALEKDTEIPSNSDIETIDSNLRSDISTDEEVYQNKQKQYDRIDDDGHHKEHEKEHHGHHKEHDKEHEKDGEGREIEIEGLKKAIAFLKKNDIFNLPKNISEVEIEVETGKKGLNKLLKNSQFKEILAKVGLPTGAAELKKLLKGGNEVEIEKEIKLPNGSTLSVEFEVEEGKIGFSLELGELINDSPPPALRPIDIKDMNYGQKLEAAFTYVPSYLTGDAKVAFQEILSNPQTLAELIELTGALALLQDTPIGPVIDTALFLAIGFDGIGDILLFGSTIYHATSEQDLKDAARNLANLIETLVTIAGAETIGSLFKEARGVLTDEAERTIEESLKINPEEDPELARSSWVDAPDVNFAPGYNQGLANRAMRKEFKEEVKKLGAEVKFIDRGGSYFSPNENTVYINVKTATPGTLVDEFAHVFNRAKLDEEGKKGAFLPDNLKKVHQDLAEMVTRLGSTTALGEEKNTLYHQLELKNYINYAKSRENWPGFMRAIPVLEFKKFFSIVIDDHRIPFRYQKPPKPKPELENQEYQLVWV